MCVAWEREADAAAELGLRVVKIRTGVVLDQDGGALAKMLPPFKLGVGGPVAGGDQYMPWIHVDDVVGIYLAALDDDAWRARSTPRAPEPVTNKAFSQGARAGAAPPGRRPGPGVRAPALYGEMAEIVTEGQRAVPDARARARLRVRAPRPRRGAARRAGLTAPAAARRLAIRRVGCSVRRAAPCAATTATSALARDDQPDDAPIDASRSRPCRGPPSRRSPCGRQLSWRSIAETSQM